jgi:putative two-component system response regulator
MQILTVDDEMLSLEILNRALRQAGYDVRSASNGQEAMEIMREEPHRIVISDWEMPGMGGLDICRAIRGDGSFGYVYFILLTSHNTAEDCVEGLSAGADDFITKPFSPTELIMRVRVAERIISLETRNVTIFAMAKLAESRDQTTGKHLERIQAYCTALAKHLVANDPMPLGSGEDLTSMITLTSPLHDIGKVSISDTILLKTGPLTDDEYEIIKTHTTAGADTLSAALGQFPEAGFLTMARDIALTHHERFDGTGYPNQLAGEDIPLCGRITALADVYDALVSARPYKPAFSHDKAKQLIVEGSGTQFDPRVVDAFVEIEDQFARILQRFSEDADK